MKPLFRKTPSNKLTRRAWMSAASAASDLEAARKAHDPLVQGDSMGLERMAVAKARKAVGLSLKANKSQPLASRFVRRIRRLFSRKL